MATHVPKVRVKRFRLEGKGGALIPLDWWTCFKFKENKDQFFARFWRGRVTFFGQLSNAKWWQISGCLGILLHFLWKSIIRHHPTREERWTYSESQDVVIFNSWPGEHFIPYTWDITTEKFGWMYLAFTPHSIIHDITGWRGKGVCHAGVNGSAKVKSMCHEAGLPKMPNFFFLPKIHGKKATTSNQQQSKFKPSRESWTQVPWICS